jgi:hypothetical protein
MTRDETIINALTAIKQTLAERVEIWIQVVERDGTLAERIYQGSFQQPRDPHTRESLSRKR